VAVPRLYVVVRADLAAGPQAVQGMHALVAFEQAHRDAFLAWRDTSNTLAFLTVPDG